MLFDWSDEKNNENVKKHNVSFEDAREVFEDAFHKSLLDRRFDYFEERWITLGLTKTGELLVVAHLYSVTSEGNEKIRIISVRKATANERRSYEED
ncbi:MAG: BrnT family toxin [Nitrospirota bacterium]